MAIALVVVLEFSSEHEKSCFGYRLDEGVIVAVVGTQPSTAYRWVHTVYRFTP